jgi:hypothetical protein
MKQAHIQSFEDFWPYYVSEHRHPTCRKLHFIGSSLVLAMAPNPLLWPLLPVTGYGFAWIGHFVFEKNKPATFDYPLWSLCGDYVMWWKTLIGRMDEELAKADALYPRAA